MSSITRLTLDSLFASPVVPHAIIHNQIVYVSGLLGTATPEGALPEDADDELEQVLLNLLRVLTAAGSAPNLLLQVTVHLTSIELLPAFNRAYARILPGELPARATVQSGLYGQCRVEVAAIAIVADTERR